MTVRAETPCLAGLGTHAHVHFGKYFSDGLELSKFYRTIAEFPAGMPVQIKWKFVIVFAAFLQFFVTAGPVYNYNVFFVDLQKEFKKSAVLTGWVGSLGSALYCAVVPLAAVIASKIGNLSIVLLGTVLASAGYLVTSFIPSLEYGYLTFGIMVGLGTSLANCAAGSLLLDWYSGQDGNCRATGGALIGTSFGVMVFGPALNTLTAAYGWRICFRILSGIALVLGLAGAMPFVKTPESQQQTKTDGKEAAVENDCSSNDQRQSTGEERASAGSIEADCDQETEYSKGPDITNVECFNYLDTASTESPVKLFLNAEMWLWVSSITFTQFGWSFAILNFLYGRDGAFSTDQISLALLAFGTAEVGSKILFAMFGDRLPFLKLYVIACSSIGGAVISGFLTLCSTFQHMIILATTWGIFRGGTYGSCIAAGDELFRIYGSRAVTSVVLLGFGLGILGSPITDGLYDLTGDYTLSLFVLIGTFVMAALSMLLIPGKRTIQSRWRCCRSTTPEPENNTNDRTESVCIATTPATRRVGHSNHAYEVDI